MVKLGFHCSRSKQIVMVSLLRKRCLLWDEKFLGTFETFCCCNIVDLGPMYACDKFDYYDCDCLDDWSFFPVE